MPQQGIYFGKFPASINGATAQFSKLRRAGHATQSVSATQAVNATGRATRPVNAIGEESATKAQR